MSWHNETHTAGVELALRSLYLLDPLDDFSLCGVAGEPGVQVGDHVDADVAQQVLGLGRGLAQGAGEEEEGEQLVEHCDSS
jgi:hypothetical protein